MNSFKRGMAAIMMVLVLSAMQSAVFAKSSVWNSSTKVKYSGGTKTVTAVSVNLNDPSVRVDAVIAKGKIGQVASLKEIANSVNSKQNQVVAAINGTFFDAYSKSGPKVPWGTIIRYGKILHIGSNGSVVGITSDKKVVMSRAKIKIVGATDGSYSWPNNWYAWGINHTYTDPKAIFILTPEYGATTGKLDRTAVIVKGGVISAVKTGEVPIPKDGYVIVLEKGNQGPQFKVGATIEYRNDNEGDWGDVVTAIGAGPTLVSNGRIVADGASEGFFESKINTAKGQRSFVGVTKNNTMIIGTVSGVSVKELAEITKNMGLVNSMNLDGGASSSLYFNGSYLTSPGRNISNALVISRIPVAK